MLWQLAAYQPPPAIYEKSVAYSAAQYRHYFLGAAYTALILVLALRWHLRPRLRTWAERPIIFAPALLLALAILGLPLDIWDHSLAHHFGVSVQGWGSWASDWITNQVVAL